MIDWTVILSTGAVALIVGITGIAFKYLTDRQATQADKVAVEINDRAAFLVSVLDEVKSLRLDADQAGIESRALWEDLRKVKIDLLACLDSRQEMGRQIKDIQVENVGLKTRIAELEVTHQIKDEGKMIR